MRLGVHDLSGQRVAIKVIDKSKLKVKRPTAVCDQSKVQQACGLTQQVAQKVAEKLSCN